MGVIGIPNRMFVIFTPVIQHPPPKYPNEKRPPVREGGESKAFHKCFAKAFEAKILEPYKNSWTSCLCADDDASDEDSRTSTCSNRPVLSKAASMRLARALFLS